MHQPRLLPLIWPLFLEMCLGIAVGWVGTIMAAHHSDDAGAAFALTNQVIGTLFLLLRVIGAGISVVITQALGAGRRDEASALARAAIGASTWIGLVIALLAVGGGGPILHLLNTPAVVLPLAAPFLVAMAPALMLDAWNSALTSVLRAHLHARDALAVIVLIHSCNLLLALTLMPRLGLPGFALSLAISRAIGLCAYLALWRWRLDLRLRGSDWWRLPRQQIGAMLHIGAPGAAENIAYRLAYMVSVAVAAKLGATALATQAYAQQLMYFVLLFGLATGFACEIVVGHLIGAGQLHAAHTLVRRALMRGLIVAVCVATLAALTAPWTLRMFTRDEAIISAGTRLMWITVLLEPGRTFNLVVINALRAAGDARYPVMAGAASMVIVLAGGSWLLGPIWGLTGLWLVYAADEWIRGLIMWRRWAQLKWVPNARMMHRRLHRA